MVPHRGCRDPLLAWGRVSWTYSWEDGSQEGSGRSGHKLQATALLMEIAGLGAWAPGSARLTLESQQDHGGWEGSAQQAGGPRG